MDGRRLTCCSCCIGLPSGQGLECAEQLVFSLCIPQKWIQPRASPEWGGMQNISERGEGQEQHTTTVQADSSLQLLWINTQPLKMNSEDIWRLFRFGRTHLLVDLLYCQTEVNNQNVPLLPHIQCGWEVVTFLEIVSRIFATELCFLHSRSDQNQFSKASHSPGLSLQWRSTVQRAVSNVSVRQ